MKTLDLSTPGSTLDLVDDFSGLAETRVSGGAVLFPTNGSASTLSNRAILTIDNSTITLDGRSVLVNGPRALLDLQGSTFVMDGSGTFTNNRDVTVRAGSTAQFGTNSVIGGDSGSTISLDCAVNLDPATAAQNSLTTSNELSLDGTNTVVTMYLNPTAKTSDRFILDGRLNISADATLSFVVTNDTVLALAKSSCSSISATARSSTPTSKT